jgi:hypothetical protein
MRNRAPQHEQIISAMSQAGLLPLLATLIEASPRPLRKIQFQHPGA